jgi:NitT/TauT family transport system permease protein
VKSRPSWLAIREPLSPGKANFLKLLSFLVPLVLWCVVSYVPWVWHPLIQITDPGDSDVFVAGQRFTPEGFKQENDALVADHLKPGKGIRVNPIYLPAPHEVARAFFVAFTTPPYSPHDLWLHQSLWHSVQIIFWGFVTSAIVGVPVGVLCGTFDSASKFFEPVIDFIRYTPAPAFSGLCLAMFVSDDGPKIAIIWIGTFFQMVLVVANTTRLLDISLLEAAQTLGANRLKLLTRVIIPGILPNLYNDMRILIGWAWTYLIIAELVGTMTGISAFIHQQGEHFHFDNAFAGIMMIGIIGLITDQILAALSVYLFPYLPNRRANPIINAIFGAITFLPQRIVLSRTKDEVAARNKAEAAKAAAGVPIGRDPLSPAQHAPTPSVPTQGIIADASIS